MRAALQRVSEASVVVDSNVIGKISKGLLVLLGIHVDDTLQEVEWMAQKILGLRIFSNSDEKLDHSVIDVGGEILVVSQFTLYGDCARGKRPDFTKAARPEKAIVLYQAFVESLKPSLKVATGEFGAKMDVQLTNDGPLTIFIDSNRAGN